jgi:hypothetical protein
MTNARRPLFQEVSKGGVYALSRFFFLSHSLAVYSPKATTLVA